MTELSTPFLLARWENLLLFNFEVPPQSLEPYLPQGVELDLFEGRAYLSLVGFHFRLVRVAGFLPTPLLPAFDELNVRFYAKGRIEGRWVRAVVFIRELAPVWWAVFLGNLLYREHYAWAHLSHLVEKYPHRKVWRLAYRWRFQGKGGSMDAELDLDPVIPPAGSLEEFLSRRFYAFTQGPKGETRTFRVEHQPWRMWPARTATLRQDGSPVFGRDLGALRLPEPSNIFAMDGSLVRVSRSRRLSLD